LFFLGFLFLDDLPSEEAKIDEARAFQEQQQQQREREDERTFLKIHLYMEILFI
jgi:hypothetical protein